MNYFKKIFIPILFFSAASSFAQTEYIIKVNHISENIPFGLTRQVPADMPKVALALSGGGARGLAQIGVLKALNEAGIPVDIVAGTSMGSIIGGLYSAGYSIDQMDSIAVHSDWDNLLATDRETNRRELFVDQKVTEDKAIFSLRLKGLQPVLPTALNSGQKISNFLNLLTFQAPIHVDSTFAPLKAKFRAVCTNLVTGTPVIIGSGSLSEAMRASSSVSFFLAPVYLDSLILVDGGLVANIPVNIARELGGNYVIAVNTTSALHPEGELSLPWEIADQVVSIPMRRLNRSELKDANADITPDLGETAINDFSNPASLISKGYQAALSQIPTIKVQIDSVWKKNVGLKPHYFKNVLLSGNETSLERPFIQKYAMQDSVSNIEILNDLNSIFEKGFYKNIKADVKDYGNYTTVKFISYENPSVKNIFISGVTLLDSAAVDSVFSTLENKPYNPGKTASCIMSVVDMYRKLGYSLAGLNSVKFDTANGDLSLNFQEGKISAIKIEGNKYTTRTVITREIPLKAGDYFRYSELKDGLTNLRSTNLFDDIFVRVVKNDGKNIVLINVKEKASSLLRVGFRVDNENKAQLSLDLVDENLFGSGTELGLLLSGGARNRAFVLEHKSNRIFNTYLTYKINAYYKSDDIYSYTDATSTTDTRFYRIQNGEYRQTFYGGSVSIGTQVQRFGNLIFEGKYQYDRIRNLQGNIQNPYTMKIVSLKASTTIDTQDKYPYPQKGFYFNGMYESAQTVLGGDIGFTNINFYYKSYFTFDGVSTFSPRVTMGFADKTLPLSEQYSIGGQNSFFGMRDNEFRGRQLFIASLEYRYKLPFKIFFDTFFKMRYDLGSVWQEQEEIRFKDLRHGIGATLSFDTPIGPADFSVGRSFLFVKNLPGNPLSWGDTFFYFSIGYYY